MPHHMHADRDEVFPTTKLLPVQVVHCGGEIKIDQALNHNQPIRNPPGMLLFFGYFPRLTRAYSSIYSWDIYSSEHGCIELHISRR